VGAAFGIARDIGLEYLRFFVILVFLSSLVFVFLEHCLRISSLFMPLKLHWQLLL
jgi:hypothetical protein